MTTIKPNHPIWGRVYQIPVYHYCKQNAITSLRNILADYNWRLGREVDFDLKNDTGCMFIKIYTDLVSIYADHSIGGVYIWWNTTNSGRIEFIANVV